MNNLELAYRQRVNREEQARLLRFLDTPDETTPSPAAPAAPAAPKASPWIVGTGLSTAGSMAKQGISNFVGGIFNSFTRDTSTPAASAGGMASGVGQSLLGTLELLMALPAGAGAAVRQAIENYAPGVDQSEALTGGVGSVASRIRSILGVPSLVLDPKMREAIRTNPQEVAASLDAPMTYGELLDLVTQFAVAGGATKVAGKVKTALAGAPKAAAPAAPAAPMKALPAPAREVGPSSVLETMTPEQLTTRLSLLSEELRAREAARPPAAPEPARAARPFRDETPAEVTGKPEAPAEAGQVLDASGQPAPIPPLDREALRAAGRTRLDEPSRVIPEPAAAPVEAPVGDLSSAVDVALRRTEDALAKDMAAFEQARVAYDARVAERAPKEPAAPVAEEPKPGALAPPTEAERAQVAKEQATLFREWQEANRYLPSHYRTQGGSIAPDLLARVAIGAVAGGSQGDTPEERIRNAFLGMGLGAALSGRFALKAAAALKDETGAVIFDRFRLGKRRAQGEESFQPNYARIDTTPGTVRFMKQVYRGVQQDIAEQARGTKTLRQIDAAAIEVLRSGKMTPERILSFEPGTVLNAEEINAARYLEIRYAEEARGLADRLLAGEVTEPGALARASALSGAISTNVRAAKAETGRALSSMRISASSRGTDAVRLHTERIEEIGARAAAGATDAEIAAMLTALPTVSKVKTWTRLYYAIPEAIGEAMYGSMLSGAAVVKNALSNLLVMPLEAAVRSAAPYAPSNLIGMARGKPTVVGFGEGPMAFIAWGEGLVEQVRMLRHWDAVMAQSERLGTTKMEVQLRGFEALASIAEDAHWPKLARGFDYLHTGFSFMPDVMRATDGMGKATNGRMAIQWEAMRQARLEGKQGPAYWQRVNEYVEDYSQLPLEALRRIADFREHNTFTKDLEGRMTSAAQAGPQDPWLQLLYRFTVAPFVRTPVRLAEFASEYTPGLNFLAQHFWTEVRQGGAQAAVAQARIAAGAAIISTFSYLAMQGLITPSEPDHKRAAALTAAGRPPGSWWDPIFDKWRSYAGIEPLSTLISTSANLVNYMRQLPEPEGTHLFLAAVLAEVDSLNSKSYTQAISELMDILVNPSSDRRIDDGFTYIRRRLGVFMPAAVREIERAYDPAQRTARPSGAFADGTPGGSLRRELYALFDHYRASLPGLSDATDEQGRPLVPADRNQFTGEIILNDTWPFNPFRARAAVGEGRSWADEVRRLRGAGLHPLGDWIGTPQAVDMGMTPHPAQPGVRLSTSERDRRIELMTQHVRIGGRPLTEAMDHLVEGRAYREQSDVTKREALQALWGDFRRSAEAALLAERPALRRAYEMQAGSAAIQHMPPARQPAANERLIRSLGR